MNGYHLLAHAFGPTCYSPEHANNHGKLLLKELTSRLAKNITSHNIKVIDQGDSSMIEFELSESLDSAELLGILDCALQFFADDVGELKVSNICSCRCCRLVDVIQLRLFLRTSSEPQMDRKVLEQLPLQQAIYLSQEARKSLEVSNKYELKSCGVELSDGVIELWVRVLGDYHELAVIDPNYRSLKWRLKNEWAKLKGSF